MPHDSRRNSFGLLLLVTGSLPVGNALCADNSEATRPNFLFCISDDHPWLHAGAYGCQVVHTPALDRVAREGVLFTNAYVSNPTCCPSRGSILTGQAFYRLGEGAHNWGTLSQSHALYPDLLAAAGYHVGCTGKACRRL